MMENRANGEMTKIPSLLTKEAAAPHMVLIHGAWHGAWCWYKLRCLLESIGYRVTCLDLAASGLHPSDPDTILSFDDYNKPLLDFMATVSDHKVILVGHSAGGISVMQIIHKFPQRVQAAVFVAANMLPFGFRTQQDIIDGKPDLSEYGDVYNYGYGLGVDQPPTTILFSPQFQRQLLYNMTPSEDVMLAKMLLRPYPSQALRNAMFAPEGGDDSWERVPRVYIKTLHDRTIKPEQQETLIKQWPPSQVYEIDSDHSPFFSNPFALFGFLVKMGLILILSFQSPLRRLVIKGLDLTKHGRGLVVAQTLSATLMLVFMSSLHGLSTVRSRLLDAGGGGNPTDQVLMAYRLLEASLLGFSLFLGLIVDRLHYYLREIRTLRKKLEDYEELLREETRRATERQEKPLKGLGFQDDD